MNQLNQMEAEVLREKLEEARLKLGRTVTQIKLIENQIRDENQRKRRALTNRRHSSSYKYKFRSKISEGVKMVYRRYLNQKAEEVRVMERALDEYNLQRERLEADRIAERAEDGEVVEPLAEDGYPGELERPLADE